MPTRIRRQQPSEVVRAFEPVPVRPFQSGIGQLAPGIEAIGSAIDIIQDKAATTRAKKLDTAYAETIRDLLHNEETGYLKTQGEAAIVGAKGAMDALAKERIALLKNEPPETRKKVEATLQARQKKANETIGLQAASEGLRAEQAASDGRIRTAITDAVQDPTQVPQSLTIVIDELGQRAEANNWTPETLQRRIIEHQTQIHIGVAHTLGNANPEEGLAYLNANQSKIEPNAFDESLIMLDTAAATYRGSEKGRAAFEGEAPESGIAVGAPDKAATSASEEGPGGTEPVKSDSIESAPQQTDDKPEAKAKLELHANPGLRSFLKEGVDPSQTDGLNTEFGTRLLAMIRSAPPEIRDQIKIAAGFRSYEDYLKSLDNAKRKVGSNGQAQKRNARRLAGPIPSSEHGRGLAADLNVETAAARTWVQENAQRFGLHFPLEHKNWQIEPSGSRDGSFDPALRHEFSHKTADRLTKRLGLPEISDPVEREAATREFDRLARLQDRERELIKAKARKQALGFIHSGQSAEAISLETQRTLGPAAMARFRAYQRQITEDGPAETDPALFNRLFEDLADNPQAISESDPTEWLGRLSQEDFETFAERRETMMNGRVLTPVLRQTYAHVQGMADGFIKKNGLTGNHPAVTARRDAFKMNIYLFAEHEAIKKGRRPTDAEITEEAQTLLARVRIDPNGFFNAINERPGRFWTEDGHLFEIDYDGDPLDESDDITLDLLKDENTEIRINGFDVKGTEVRNLITKHLKDQNELPEVPTLLHMLIRSGKFIRPTRKQLRHGIPRKRR
ncbi:MAG: M15 family metallopeptidase [Pseudomonadota bacterium]